jgi:hypothetical protein
MSKWVTTLWQSLVNGIEPASGTPGLDFERRQTPRLPCRQTLSCRQAALADTPWVAVQLQDISAGGLAALSPCSFERDNLLEVERPGPPGRPTWRLISCVRHVRQQGPGCWLLGCSFIRELEDEELQAFQQTERPGRDAGS